LPKTSNPTHGTDVALTKAMENELQPLRLLTIPEAAELLQVSTRTLQRLIHRKELPALKVGGQWRINESQLTKWIQGLSEL
jgi:excisionase family DNA binding protein